MDRTWPVHVRIHVTGQESQQGSSEPQNFNARETSVISDTPRSWNGLFTKTLSFLTLETDLSILRCIFWICADLWLLALFGCNGQSSSRAGRRWLSC